MLSPIVGGNVTSKRIPTRLGQPMKHSHKNSPVSVRLRASCLTLAAAAGVMSMATGCQVALNGQTLPSPYYLQDDVQYFPAGPEFKLPREAAALRAARAEEKKNQL